MYNANKNITQIRAVTTNGSRRVVFVDVLPLDIIILGISIIISILGIIILS